MFSFQRTVLALGIALSSTAASAEEACLALIRHAMYNDFAGSTSSSSYKEASDRYCKTYSDDADKRQEADTGASYGWISGYGNFSNDEKDSVREAVCSDKYSLDKYKSHTEVFSRTLSAQALAVAQSCIEAAGRRVQFIVKYVDENTMTVDANFLPQVGDGDHREINGPISIPSGLSCTGELATATTKFELTTVSTNMTCRRMPPFTVFKEGDGQFIHHGGSVVVTTSVGSLTAIMPKEPDPNFKPPAAPPAVVEVGGQWLMGGNKRLKPTQIATVANSDQLVFTNEFDSTSHGRRLNALTLETYAWNHLSVQVVNAGKFLFFSNGTWWSRDEFDTIHSQPSNKALADTWHWSGLEFHVTGDDQHLTFSNNSTSSPGPFLNSDTVQAPAWGGIKGRLISDRSLILWSNGTYWTR